MNIHAPSEENNKPKKKTPDLSEVKNAAIQGFIDGVYNNEYADTGVNTINGRLVGDTNKTKFRNAFQYFVASKYTNLLDLPGFTDKNHPESNETWKQIIDLANEFSLEKAAIINNQRKSIVEQIKARYTFKPEPLLQNCIQTCNSLSSDELRNLLSRKHILHEWLVGNY